MNGVLTLAEQERLVMLQAYVSLLQAYPYTRTVDFSDAHSVVGAIHIQRRIRDEMLDLEDRLWPKE